MKKLKYSLKNIAPLGAIRVVVSPYVQDDKIVIRERRNIETRPSLSPKIFAAYKISIWDLETGVIAGDADITKSDEWHMSAG